MKLKFHDLIKSLLFITVLTIFSSCNLGRHQGSNSPDGSLVLTVENTNGMLTYSLSKNEKIIIENSRLGIKADKFDLSDDLEAVSWESNDHKGKWTQVWGEQREIKDNYGEMLVGVKSNKNAFKMNVRFRLFDDGLGFRYEIPKQDALDSYNILDEITEFNFP